MEKKHLEQFRQLFKQLELNAQGELDQVLALDEAHRGDDVDRSESDRNNSLQLKLIARNRHFVQKIHEAQERIENGTFGECVDCGASISTSRLFARPTAHLCINCKEEQEGEERMIRYDKKSHTHGKSLFSAENLLGFTRHEEDSLSQKIPATILA